MLHRLPHNEWRLKNVSIQVWAFIYESLSLTHDTFHKLNAPSGSADEVVALGHQEMTTKHSVVDPGLRVRSQCCLKYLRGDVNKFRE